MTRGRTEIQARRLRYKPLPVAAPWPRMEYATMHRTAGTAGTPGTPGIHLTRTIRPLLAAALVTGVLTSSAASEIQPHAGMLRYPDVSATDIVFAYANDLWIVPRAGGTATPLASPPGQELFPKFDVDGDTIAFVGNYDGNRDLYTIPVTGGIPVRVTFHPSAEILCDWTPDGRLCFYARGYGGIL